MLRQSPVNQPSLFPLVASSMAALWVGKPSEAGAHGDEMAFALRWAEERLQVSTVPGVAEAVQHNWADCPSVILLPMAWSGAVCDADLIGLASRWPLAELVVVTSTAVDGRRRRGPALPGAVAIPWYEMPGRIGQWLRRQRDGGETLMGRPATSRREERILAGIAPRCESLRPVLRAAVAATTRSQLDALELLASSAGVWVVSRHQGPPPPDVGGDVVLWDVGSVGDAELDHVAGLADASPARPVLLLEAFPRGATTAAVVEAGAAHVLGQPVEADVLAETVHWAWQASRG